MTALSPLARAFVDQTVQSAMLHQKHRAQIWTKLQQRVLTESPCEAPRHSPRGSWLGLSLKSPVGWVGSVVLFGAILANVLGNARQLGPTAENDQLEACPPLPRQSHEANLAASVVAVESAEAMPPAIELAAQQALDNRPKTEKSTIAAVARAPANRKRSRRSPAPSRQVAPLLPHRDLEVIVVGRSARMTGLHPTYAGLSYELQPENLFRSGTVDDSTNGATHRSDAQFVVAPSSLELPPHLAGALLPLGEAQFESSLPLKLTQPQLRLTSAAID